MIGVPGSQDKFSWMRPERPWKKHLKHSAYVAALTTSKTFHVVKTSSYTGVRIHRTDCIGDLAAISRFIWVRSDWKATGYSMFKVSRGCSADTNFYTRRGIVTFLVTLY